jgi:glucose/arabinose dehydrogenase
MSGAVLHDIASHRPVPESRRIGAVSALVWGFGLPTSRKEPALKSLNALAAAVAAAVLCFSIPLLAAIQLVPVVPSGLSGPLFIGHAGDGTNRLFIVERPGVIKVLQPGASTPTVFLDIRSRITSSGGEQGLLGLAFHPLHESNGRFFVFYTRVGDGTLVIAEYGLTGNRNVADPDETVLLTIPHSSFTNHNGGMLAFGPDNFLYIGVGDGGGSNDPPGNGQNVNTLLGKLLRIDIDTPGGGDLYSSPATNPFFGTTNGEDEIFSYGLRNPWRFSFDRSTGQLWLADVGQGAFEEVNSPMVNGGNYGWDPFEGFACTSTNPENCDTTGLIFPVFDYSHSGGRCSITGGYVYRGSQGAVADGTYVYGDFCSGEILGWNGSAQSVLLDTTLMISSFGEDEAGELYVVNLNGSVSRIASTTPPPPCTYAISPVSASYTRTGGTGSVAVTAGAGCSWTAESNASWITITGGASGSGNGTVTYSVGPYGGPPKKRNGTATIAGRTFTVNQTK